MNRFLLLIFFLLLVDFTSTNAQNTISGKVTDAETGNPTPGVNIFLANTTIGTSTDKEGRYELDNIPLGNHILVFSFIGYKSKTVQVKIGDNSSGLNIDAKLQPDIYEMNEVSVVSSNKKWEKNFERFEKAFIGQTEFAQETTIENPWVIDFENDKDTNDFIAKAEKPIIINNLALGYKIHIELVQFKWSGYLDTGVYKIYSRFESLAAKNYKQRQRWTENRVKAYLGSFNQFLKNLFDDKLMENRFSLSRSRDITMLSKSEARYEARRQGKFLGDRLNMLKGFRIDRRVSVRYRNIERVKMGDKELKVVIRKQGAIEGNTDNNVFFVRKSGKLLDPASVIIYGHWAQTRVADNLPSNYQLGD